MPILSASSGIVMPGLAFTRSNVWLRARAGPARAPALARAGARRWPSGAVTARAAGARRAGVAPTPSSARSAPSRRCVLLHRGLAAPSAAQRSHAFSVPGNRCHACNCKPRRTAKRTLERQRRDSRISLSRFSEASASAGGCRRSARAEATAPSGAEGRLELVLVLEVRAAVAVLGQALGDARLASARGPCPPTRRGAARRPRASSQCTSKFTPRRHSVWSIRYPALSVAAVVLLAARGGWSPTRRAVRGVHDELPHRLAAGRRCRCSPVTAPMSGGQRLARRQRFAARLPLAQRALDGGVEACAGARRAAPARASSRGSRSLAEAVHQRPDERRGPRRRSSPPRALRHRASALIGRRSGGRPTSMQRRRCARSSRRRSGRRGRRCRATARPPAAEVAAPRSGREHVAAVDRLRCGSRASGGSGMHAAGARRGARGSGTSATAAPMTIDARRATEPRRRRRAASPRPRGGWPGAARSRPAGTSPPR